MDGPENSQEARSAEVAELAAALAAELAREMRRGRRRVEVAVPAQERAAREPTAPIPRSAGDPARPAPALPTAARSRAAAPAEVSRSAEAAEIRARAAAAPDLPALAAEVARCTACSLCRTRKQTVFSDGRARLPIMFVGEAPGADEDAQGVPFVGRAGALLTDIITKGMGLTREDVYIANVLKCRPPDNRDPAPQEKELCTGWLDRQIQLVDPRVIVPLGRHAAGHLLHSEASLGSLRARVHRSGGRAIVPTYHPAFLLRSPQMKRACWEDIQLAMTELGLEPPTRRRGDSSGSP